MRTGELTEKVILKYGSLNGAENLGKYIPLTQVASSTGGANTIADLMVLGAWHSSGNYLDGFEVKVSRADWLNEVKNPNKCLPSKQYCHRWWLVIADENIVKEGELPEDWGMMAVVDGKLKVIKKAPFLTPIPLTIDFVASLLRTDARATIPLDVHRDRCKDAVRDAEQDMKKKYQLLMDYVKFLNKAFGIELEKSNWSEQWSAKIRQGRYSSRHFSQEQLLSHFKQAMSENLKDLEYKFERMRDIATEVIELVGKKEQN